MLKIYDKFKPRANQADGDYPYGSIKNESVPGAKDGTPLDAQWGNDYAGFDAALLDAAGLTADGNPDTVVASQRLEALKIVINKNADLHDTLAGAKSRTDLADNPSNPMRVYIYERKAWFNVVSGEISNNQDIIQHDSLPLQLKAEIVSTLYLSSFGYGEVGNTPEVNYAALVRFAEWCNSATSIPTIIHPPYEVQIRTTIPDGTVKSMASDITDKDAFIFDFNGGKLTDLTDVAFAGSQLIMFVTRRIKIVKFLNSNIEGQMPLPSTDRRGTTFARVYDSECAEFKGSAKGMITHFETRQCKKVINKGRFNTMRYPFLTFECANFKYVAVNENCWRDFFIQGGSGNLHVNSEIPHQHAMIKSYENVQKNENIVGYYKARNRPSTTSPTGQIAIEIESDEQAIFRNIDIEVDIEGEYERPFMMRNFKRNGDLQTAALGHVIQNVNFSGRYKNTTANVGNLWLVGGGYFAGDFIQNYKLSNLTVVGSFVANLDQILPAIDASNKMKWENFTLTDAFLQTHDQGFYKNYLRCINVNFPGKAYSSNDVQEFGVLRSVKKYIGNLSTGVSVINVDSTKTLNQIVVNYCATNSESTFSPFIEGRLSGLIVYPSSGIPSETVVDTQYAQTGTAGIAEIFEVSTGVLGFKIPEWTAVTNGMVQLDVMINYSSYGEDDFSSLPGLVYAPYSAI